MLYEVLRAFLASVLPLLPIMFQTGNLKLDDWTRTISSAITPEYLSPGHRSNISINPQALANDIDYSITLDSLGYPLRPLRDSPPVFDAIAAIARKIYPLLSFRSHTQTLIELIPVLLAIAVWIRRPSTRSPLKRLLPLGLDTPEPSATNTNATSALVQCSSEPSPQISEVLTNEELSFVSVGSLLETYAGSGLDPVESSETEQTSSPPLLLWDQELATPWVSLPDVDEWERSRSLSDISEQSEPEDSDIEVGTSTPRRWSPAILRGSDDLLDRTLMFRNSSSTISQSDDDTFSSDDSSAGDSELPVAEPNVDVSIPVQDAITSLPRPMSPDSVAAMSIQNIEDELSNTAQPPGARLRRLSSVR
ncbi:hypothetical protein C8Q79DRAFT_753076 [Trametes meyenii]|nr:hypothetical protein C8Q79DRAFT_753076 [Trametes meyenii]